MLHISFAMYVLSLLSGVLLLSALGNNPRYRCVSGYREFTALYLVITAFVCITSLCLYLSVNVSTDTAFRQQILKVYLMTTFLFLGLLPNAIEKYNSTIYRFTSPSWFIGYLLFNMLYDVAGAIVIWWPTERWQGLIIGFSLALYIAALAGVSLLARRHYAEVFKGGTTKLVSRIMLTQSLSLPLIEVLFWSEHLARDGFTYSLPVIYLVNNALLWIYRDALMPGTGETVPLKNMKLLLSAKEQQIVQALAEGLSNKQIAAKLGVAPSTVKNHIYSIFKKCNVTNRIALIQYLRSPE
jgi:DNA-binding CsgD family transcriptional regulator